MSARCCEPMPYGSEWFMLVPWLTALVRHSHQRRHQAVTFHNEAFDVSPIRSSIDDKRHPTLFADVGRFEIPRIFNQKSLQRQRRFETDAQVALVPLQNGKRPGTCFECWMTPGFNFVGLG